LGLLLGTTNYPALFDVKRIFGSKGLAGYLAKYVTKQGKVCSLFGSRTWSASKRLRDFYKASSDSYEQKFTGENAFRYLNEVGRASLFLGRPCLVEVRDANQEPISPYFSLYRYDKYFYDVATRLKSECLYK